MPDEKTTYGLLGTAIHSGIQAQYETGELAHSVFDEVLLNTLREWEAKGLEYSGYSYQDMRRIGYEILDSFDYSLYEPMPGKMELDFTVTFPAVNPICLVRGFIDMPTVDDRIVDFKSSAKKPTKRDVNNSAQLLIYEYAFQQVFGRKPKDVLIHHLRTQSPIYFRPENKEQLYKELTDTIREIIAYNPPAELERCNNCAMFCPMYKGTHGHIDQRQVA